MIWDFLVSVMMLVIGDYNCDNDVGDYSANSVIVLMIITMMMIVMLVLVIRAVQKTLFSKSQNFQAILLLTHKSKTSGTIFLAL